TSKDVADGVVHSRLAAGVRVAAHLDDAEVDVERDLLPDPHFRAAAPRVRPAVGLVLERLRVDVDRLERLRGALVVRPSALSADADRAGRDASLCDDREDVGVLRRRELERIAARGLRLPRFDVRAFGADPASEPERRAERVAAEPGIRAAA